MSPLKRGTVIDVNLDPTKGSETGRIRPCIIVTNEPLASTQPARHWDRFVVVNTAGDGFFERITSFPESLGLVGPGRETLWEVPKRDGSGARAVRLEPSGIAELHTTLLFTLTGNRGG